MAKKFACWIGRHAWTKQVARGESYTVCADCGRSPRRTGGNWKSLGRGIDLANPAEKEDANRF